jgi:hypothetical protein
MSGMIRQAGQRLLKNPHVLARSGQSVRNFASGTFAVAGAPFELLASVQRDRPQGARRGAHGAGVGGGVETAVVCCQPAHRFSRRPSVVGVKPGWGFRQRSPPGQGQICSRTTAAGTLRNRRPLRTAVNILGVGWK